MAVRAQKRTARDRTVVTAMARAMPSTMWMAVVMMVKKKVLDSVCPSWWSCPIAR